jgi:hypothetical protein
MTFTKGTPGRRADDDPDIFSLYFNWLMPQQSRARGILHDRYIGPIMQDSKAKLPAFHVT